MEPIKLVKYALDSTVALIAKGEHPTSALEKVARELELNTNYIQRTGEALNVALHYDHFKKVASADKAKEFPVADIPGVQKNIFGAKEKTLAQKKAEWFPKATLDIDYNSYLTNPAFKEQTNNILKTAANFDSFKTSLTGQYKKAAEYIDVLNKTIDKLKTEKVSHDTYLESSFNNLVKHFKKEAAARTAFHEFESQAYSAHGKRVAPYLDLI
jgi:Glu-tRNA(Gln) amidotransferase subunit E-like FAD-binding protein